MAFIVFEGLDGAGKSTLIAGLEKLLVEKKIEYLRTREPGGTPLGEEIREQLLRVKGDAPVPRAELLLYQASRAQHVEKVIRPALEKKKWVLCDRYYQSTLAFQVGGRKLNSSKIEWLNSFAIDGVEPNLVVLIDLPVSVSLSRIKSREGQIGQELDRFEKEEEKFHQGVRDNYLEQAKANPNLWLVLDGQNEVQVLMKKIISKMGDMGWLES